MYLCILFLYKYLNICTIPILFQCHLYYTLPLHIQCIWWYTNVLRQTFWKYFCQILNSVPHKASTRSVLSNVLQWGVWVWSRVPAIVYSFSNLVWCSHRDNRHSSVWRELATHCSLCDLVSNWCIISYKIADEVYNTDVINTICHFSVNRAIISILYSNITWVYTV